MLQGLSKGFIHFIFHVYKISSPILLCSSQINFRILQTKEFETKNMKINGYLFLQILKAFNMSIEDFKNILIN
jgi:hypothetical protein